MRVELGQKVAKGDPLLDLYQHRSRRGQERLSDRLRPVAARPDIAHSPRKPLQENAISEQLLVDTQNDENKSRLAVTTARQKLLVLAVPEEQIDPLVKNLGDPVSP